MARQVFSLKIHKSTEDACPSPTTAGPFPNNRWSPLQQQLAPFPTTAGLSPVPSPEGKGRDHRDTPIKKDVGFTLSLISIENSSNAL